MSQEKKKTVTVEIFALQKSGNFFISGGGCFLFDDRNNKNWMEIKHGSKNKTINICKKQTENKQ